MCLGRCNLYAVPRETLRKRGRARSRAPLDTQHVARFDAHRKVPPRLDTARSSARLSGALVCQALLQLAQVCVGQLQLDVGDPFAARAPALRCRCEPGALGHARWGDSAVRHECYLSIVLAPPDIAKRTIHDVDPVIGAQCEPGARRESLTPIVCEKQKEPMPEYDSVVAALGRRGKEPRDYRLSTRQATKNLRRKTQNTNTSKG